MKNNNLPGLHWFRHDLRLEDNPALFELLSISTSLICVYVVDPRWFRPSHYQSAHMGRFRWAFLLESLQELDKQLRKCGQALTVLYGDPVEQVSNLVEQYNVVQVSANQHSGLYERQQWQRVQKAYSHIHYIYGHGHSLFHPDQLPFRLTDLPKSFTPFRKQVEHLKVDRPIRQADAMPGTPDGFKPFWSNLLPIAKVSLEHGWRGGATEGLEQLHDYLFETNLVLDYKQTRNGLDGWDYSSKLSAWLANGSVSARQIYNQLRKYEQQVKANESTYWLFFELLWREYFYWYGIEHKQRLFRIDGVQQKKPLTSFWPQRFARWCAGNTPYPIVNACMKQLNTTGYMSNRGRQLVASCLVHEFGLDWRYGAAYFEQQLIDFDVASNYGNWQYLAGVGADPRGHRKFDLDKQTRQYDPDHSFINKWQGQASQLPLDDIDPSDWPISWH